MPIALAYIATVVSLAVIDFLWIGVLFKDTYQKGLPYLAEHFNMYSAVALYVIYALGIWFFVIAPSHTWLEAMERGAFLGFVAYSLYDLTNITILNGWPVGLGLIDILWGTVLTALCSGIGYGVLVFFSK